MCITFIILLLFSAFVFFFFFFFNDTATTEIYTLSLHDALPIFGDGNALADLRRPALQVPLAGERHGDGLGAGDDLGDRRSEEHTSELQSRQYLVCRLLLEKKKKTKNSEQDADQKCEEHYLTQLE